MRLVFSNTDQFCDYAVDPTDGDRLDVSQVLESALLAQILSDAQAAPNVTIPDGSGNRRGWCVDDIEPNGRAVGSRLWLAYHGKATPGMRRQVKRDLEESAHVFVSAGIASRAYVEVQTIRVDTFGITVFLYRPEDPHTLLARLWLEVKAITNAVP